MATARTILNDEQLERFMEAIKADICWYDFFYLEITTGLRRGELCGLMWPDFDEKKGTITIRRTLHTQVGGGYYVGDTKTGAGRRTIKLPPSTVQLLAERKKKSISQWIFPNPIRPEDPVMPDRGYHRMKKLLKEAGLPNMRFRDLRHTFATHALTSGVDAKTLSGILGHTKTSFTLDTYTHVTGDMHRRASGSWAALWKNSWWGGESMARKRKNGQGTVRLRKDGRWEGRHIVGYDENGKPKTKNVLAKTKAECDEKPKKLQEEYGQVAPFRIKPDMRFGDWIDYWYENHAKLTIRPTTQKGYEEWIYVHAIPGLGHIKLNKLTQADCQKFLNEMKTNGRKIHRDIKGAEMSERSVRSCYHVIRMALERAIKDGLIKKNPILGVKLPPPEPKEMKVLSKEEIQRFLIQAKVEGMYELFLLELTTGMRRGEILALTWNDLNFETGGLRINKQIVPVGGTLITGEPKTKAAFRTIILPPVMVDVLREYKKGIFSHLMFPSRIKPEQPIDPGYVRKRLQVILERADCKRVRFHDLRHTFATMSLEHGMDVKTLSAIIGHVSAKTTLNIYTHITSEMEKNAAASIDRGIAKAEVGEREAQKPAEPQSFTPYQTPRRRPGTGYVKQLNGHLWEGRYSPVWPDGKKHFRNVYGRTREEAEAKLADLILQMKAEIAALRSGKTKEYPDGVSPKKKQLAAYLRENPGVSNKAISHGSWAWMSARCGNTMMRSGWNWQRWPLSKKNHGR